MSAETRDRALGALLGLAVGDALGTTLEFQSRDSLPPLTDMVGGGPFGLSAGQWTDDTAMALALADSLLKSGGRIDKRDLLVRFVNWWQWGENSCTGTCFDIGIATRQAFERFLCDGVLDAGSTDPGSAGNGCIMRLAPVAIRWFREPPTLLRAAREQAMTTHGAPECLEASEILAGVLGRAIETGHRDWSLDIPGPATSTVALAAVSRGQWRTKTRDQINSSGWVTATLEAAFWCVANSTSFAQAVLLAANLGDDADTVAAVTGQIAGALYGSTGIPSAWLTRLAWCEEIADRADRLYSSSILA